MHISGFIEESVVDGPNIRAVVFISGCKHCCKGCHNPESWDFFYGKPFTEEEQIRLAKRVSNNPLIKGLTISGGDPIYSTPEVIKFIKLYKQYNPKHTVWLYTGFTYEQVLANKEYSRILPYIDVLVDSLFDFNSFSLNCKFKGSSNQRIIDVKSSLREDRLVELYKEV